MRQLERFLCNGLGSSRCSSVAGAISQPFDCRYFAVLVLVSAFLEWKMILQTGESADKFSWLGLMLVCTPTLAAVIARVALGEGIRDISFHLGGREGRKALLVAWLFPLWVGLVAYGAAWASRLAQFQAPVPQGVIELPANPSANFLSASGGAHLGNRVELHFGGGGRVRLAGVHADAVHRCEHPEAVARERNHLGALAHAAYLKREICFRRTPVAFGAAVPRDGHCSGIPDGLPAAADGEHMPRGDVSWGVERYHYICVRPRDGRCAAGGRRVGLPYRGGQFAECGMDPAKEVDDVPLAWRADGTA